MRHFEIHRVMTEQLFNAPKAIETLASGTMNVYGPGKGLDRRNDMAWASGGPGPGPREVPIPS